MTAPVDLVITPDYVGPDRRAPFRPLSAALARAASFGRRRRDPGVIAWRDTVPAELVEEPPTIPGLLVVELHDLEAFHAAQKAT